MTDAAQKPAFSVLSLNTFGIPFYLSTWRIRPLTAILRNLAPTVICLQEVQQNAYVPALQRGLKGYSDFAFFHKPFAPRGGLFTAAASGCKVRESKFYPFPNQGKPLSIGFSDWWLNKGVLLVNLEVAGTHLVAMNTHLQANYMGDWQPSNAQTQIQLDQVSYLVELIQAQSQDAWVTVCGDFNFPREAPAYERMANGSGMTDPLLRDPRSTYQPFPLVPPKWKMTLDYFFYRPPRGERADVTADIVPIVNPAGRYSVQRFLTDHQALLLNIG
ncbi:MAG TPA: endonuclease/exonuclease/phosphatase family protein [Anaerolineales bacterium]|nr:endonuclease/exonuclease/phosphatase family protein [Anaerolineales bacterium]